MDSVGTHGLSSCKLGHHRGEGTVGWGLGQLSTYTRKRAWWSIGTPPGWRSIKVGSIKWRSHTRTWLYRPDHLQDLRSFGWDHGRFDSVGSYASDFDSTTGNNGIQKRQVSWLCESVTTTLNVDFFDVYLVWGRRWVLVSVLWDDLVWDSAYMYFYKVKWFWWCILAFPLRRWSTCLYAYPFLLYTFSFLYTRKVSLCFLKSSSVISFL